MSYSTDTANSLRIDTIAEKTNHYLRRTMLTPYSQDNTLRHSARRMLSLLFLSYAFVAYIFSSSVNYGELISITDTQDAAKARGAAQTAQFGRNAVYIRANFDMPGFGSCSDYFSGILTDDLTIGNLHPKHLPTSMIKAKCHVKPRSILQT